MHWCCGDLELFFVLTFLGLSSCFSFLWDCITDTEHTLIFQVLASFFFSPPKGTGLTLSWLELLLSWCSNILYCHMRTASEDLPNRRWACHNRLDLDEWSKDGNYRNVILNVSVSHNLFVSNRMPSGDFGKSVWDTPHHLCSHWIDCCPALGPQRTQSNPTRVLLAELISETGKELRMQPGTSITKISCAAFSVLDRSMIFREREGYRALWCEKVVAQY